MMKKIHKIIIILLFIFCLSGCYNYEEINNYAIVSGISIVGALVLGQAAVEAGIVSPITIIIVGISSVASLAFSSIELINSIKWVQLFLIILAALFGFIGVMFGFIMLMALLISQNSCGKPYFSPFEPFNFKAQKDAIITKKSAKFNPDIVYDKDDDDEKNS